MLPLLDVGLVEEASGAKELSYCMPQPVASQLQWLTRVSPAVSSNWLAYLEEVFAAELTAADQRFSEQLALLPLAEAVVQAALSFLPPLSSSSSSAPEKAEAQQFARRCRRMGSLAMSAKNSKMALKFFKNVHQIYTNLSLQNTIEMGEAHFLVGTAQATPAEAIASYKEALKIQEPILGSVHPVVAVTKYKIANSLRMQNKPDLSIAMYEDVASIQRQVSPPVPIDLAATLNNLGVMYLLKRAPDKALVLLKESLDLRIKTLGPQHLQLRDNLANLADCYKTLNRPADVLFYNCELLSLLRANICPEFKSEAATLCLSVAQTQRDLAMYQDARASFEEARLRFSELPGDNMINISKSLHGIAQVCLSLGDDLRASEALNEELDVLSKASGNTSLEKNECKFLLGCIESSRGRHQEALVLLEESLSVKRSKVGSNDAGVASNQLLIAKSHLHLENTDLAKAALEDALRIMRLLKDPKINYAELSLTQYLLASIAFDEGKYTDALELFQGAVSARHKCHQGSVSAEIADALYGVAIAQCALRHNSSAQKTMEEVAALRKTLLGAEHEDSRTAAAMAATISGVASKFSEATVRS
jgi:tetratricopeptide (TPR) repeat protein